MSKNWRLMRPRKHASSGTRVVSCLKCKAEIDREKDAHLKDSDDDAWCLDCGEHEIDDQLSECEGQMISMRRVLLKLIVARDRK